MLFSFEDRLSPAQREIFTSLDSPVKIQAYLDTTRYSAEEANRCPVRVLNDQQAHCLDGGLFAAAALRRLGDPPVIVDLLPEPGLDDDHVLAIFRRAGRWGAVAKSNFVGLRYREPVYRSLRELVMSYFEQFYNSEGVKTLRSYTRPVDLTRFDHLNWMGSDAGVDAIEKFLKGLATRPLLTPEMAAALAPVDPLSYQAGMLATDPAGLYRPVAKGAQP